MKAKLFLLFFGLLGFVVQAAAKEKIYVNSEVTTLSLIHISPLSGFHP